MKQLRERPCKAGGIHCWHKPVLLAKYSQTYSLRNTDTHTQSFTHTGCLPSLACLPFLTILWAGSIMPPWPWKWLNESSANMNECKCYGHTEQPTHHLAAFPLTPPLSLAFRWTNRTGSYPAQPLNTCIIQHFKHPVKTPYFLTIWSLKLMGAITDTSR